MSEGMNCPITNARKDGSMDETHRLGEWMRGSRSDPHRLNLLLTYKCNLDCTFCGDAVVRSHNRSMDELPDDVWLRTAREAADLGVAEWWVPGLGEPLVRGDLLIALFGLAKEKNPNARCKMTTNGSLFTAASIEQFAVLADRISMSLDSPDEETHDYLRGRKGTFERVVAALEGFNRHEKKPVINFNTVLTSKNYHQLDQLCDLGEHYGVEFISLNPLRVDTGNMHRVREHQLRLTDAQKVELSATLPRLSEKRCRLIFNGFQDLEMGIVAEKAEGFGKPGGFLEAACFEPWLTMTINYKGDATYCTSCGHWDLAENIADKPLREIWLGPSFTVARERMLNHEPLPSCFGCGIKETRNSLRKRLDDVHGL